MKKSVLTQARLQSLAFCFLANAVQAQPAVVDFGVQQATIPVTTQSETVVEPATTETMPQQPSKPLSSNQMSGELFYQLQILQEEVMTLRGQLEEQGGELQRLKQQRLDDFLMMDRRMSLLEQSAVSDTPVTSNPSAAVSFGDTGVNMPDNSVAASGVAAASPAVVDHGDADKAAYKAAYDLIKTRQLDQAEIAFEKFLVDYQGSSYCANAYYWLGELYDRKGKMDKARAAFVQVLEQYPDSNKIPDALYKLGKVYHQLGDNEKAQEYLNAVISKYGNTSRTAVRQAREYLKKNFSGNG